MSTIGVDVGGTKCLGVVLDDAGDVAAEHRVPTPQSRSGPALVDAVAEVARELQAGRSDLVGVGVPGIVDRDGVLRFAPNIPGVTELALQAELARRLGVDVRIDNDATCAAWAEQRFGAGSGRQHMILVTLGTGIGGGIVIDGRLVRGAHGFAGEIGHMVVDAVGGLPCPCGQRGCWERYASGSGLGRLAREAAHAQQIPHVVDLAGGDAEAVRGEHVTQAAAEGDPDAQAVMDRFGWWVALGLANLANAFDTECFVLGGGLVEAGSILLDPVRAAFLDLVEAAEHRPPVEIVAATLGERAGAIGAALLAATPER
ncbi:MAG TPA: ROK family protein [Acidimicrobiales bacterium]|nr:ROK family protein [Acidimicrobiales bacterium]